jgi:uncharacterized SAM-binding protein YcdF (DUF218 family)
MESLFFVASKTIGMATRVETWALAAMAFGLFALWRGRVRAAGRWFAAVFLATLALTLLPLGDLILRPLEAQYPAHPPLARLDGIIVLGGAEESGAHRVWGGFQANDAGERLVEAAALALQHPDARLVFTGGTARLTGEEDTTAPSTMARDLWLSLGVAPDRVLLEQASRNTSENAAMVMDLVHPKPGEVWVLVTSAFHMPRSVEVFHRAGWHEITPWPVDFRSRDLADGRGIWRLDRNLQTVNIALKEYVGTLVYRVIGK